MTDVRRFDFLERVVADERRRLDDFISTVLGRSGAHRPIPVVTSTGQITAPYTGMLILNTTDNMIYEHNGVAWVGVLALGGSGAQIHDAVYYQSASHTINNATDTKIRFQTAITTSPDVTASGTGNQEFTLNRAGLWRVEACVTYAGSGGSGDRLIAIETGSALDFTKRISQSSVGSAGAALVSVTCGVDVRVSVGTVMKAVGFQTSGGAIGTEVFFGALNHISLTWMRP